MKQWIRLPIADGGLACLTVLLVAAFYHPLLNLSAIPSGGDSANLFWPIKILIQDSIAHDGVVPLWNPWSFMGAPLVASLQHAVFYPVDRVLYALVPAHAGIHLGNLLHLCWAGAGMFYWLRRGLGMGAWASVTAGAAFPCTAWFWGQQEHINQLAAISYLPWLALTVLLFVKERITARRFIVVYTGLSAFQFLTGHPQETFYAQFFCVLLALGIVLTSPEKKRILRRVLPAWAGSLALLGLLVAVQLLPTMEANSHSRRQFKDPTYAISFSMPPDLLVTYLAPHYFGSFRDGYYLHDEFGNPLLDPAGNPAWDRRAYGEYGLFIGVPLLLLAFIGIGTAGRRRWLPLGLLLIALCALLLALGGNTDPRRLAGWNFTEFPEPGWSLHEIFLRLFPPAQGFRVPARISILTTFSILTLAAFGIQTIAGRLVEKRIRHFALPAIAAACLLALYLPSRKEKYHYPMPAEPMARLLQTMPDVPRTLDNRMYRLTLSDDTRLINERHLEALPGWERGLPLLERFGVWQPHMNVPRHQPLVDGYEEGLIPTARFKDWIHAFNRNLRSARPEQHILNILGIARIYSDLPIDTDVYPPVETPLAGEGAVYANPQARGAAFWAFHAEGIDFRRIDGPWWQGGEPLPGYSTRRVMFGDLMRWEEDLDRFPAIETEILTLNHIRIAPLYEPPRTRPGNAILAMGWYPGWEFVDPRAPQETAWISAVHLDLPGPAANAETGHWEIAYRPFSYNLGLFLTALGLAIWSAMRRITDEECIDT